MVDSKGNIKDIHVLFEEIKNRNPNYKGINDIYNLYEKNNRWWIEKKNKRN